MIFISDYCDSYLRLLGTNFILPVFPAIVFKDARDSRGCNSSPVFFTTSSCATTEITRPIRNLNLNVTTPFECTFPEPFRAAAVRGIPSRTIIERGGIRPCWDACLLQETGRRRVGRVLGMWKSHNKSLLIRIMSQISNSGTFWSLIGFRFVSL